VPLEAGSTDADYELVYRAIVEPVLEQFNPQLTVISAGYDAHERDPLASMRLTTGGYASIIRRIRATASRSGPLALVTEGGYDLPALASCLEATIAVLDDGLNLQGETPRSVGEKSARGERAAAVAATALSGFWKLG
jgi:acetoin utilization deacetylase AcuC-like enzyme